MPYHDITFLQKYNAVKDTLKFSLARLADAVEILKQELFNETLGKFGLKRNAKPKCFYRRFCINEWFFPKLER